MPRGYIEWAIGRPTELMSEEQIWREYEAHRRGKGGFTSPNSGGNTSPDTIAEGNPSQTPGQIAITQTVETRQTPQQQDAVEDYQI